MTDYLYRAEIRLPSGRPMFTMVGDSRAISAALLGVAQEYGWSHDIEDAANGDWGMPVNFPDVGTPDAVAVGTLAQLEQGYAGTLVVENLGIEAP